MKKNFFLVTVSTILLFTMLLTGIQKVKAEDTPIVYVDPPISHASKGKYFSINISVFNVSNLYAWQFYLSWNSALLEVPDNPATLAIVEGVTEGPFLKNAGETNMVTKMRNETTLFALCSLRGMDPLEAPNGNGTLAHVTFLVKAEGECNINLSNTMLIRFKSVANPVPELIPHMVEHGYFEVPPPSWTIIHEVFVGEQPYDVVTESNSTISGFEFNQTLTQISFNVSGEIGTYGFCRICIPTALMNDTYKVFVNGTEIQYDLLPSSNSTHSCLYFTYNHSTQQVVIVPEFPTWTSMLLLFIVLTITIALHKRRLLKTPIH